MNGPDRNNSIWDVYLNTHILNETMIWSGPNASSLPLDTPIHIITACNPHELKLTDKENAERNKALLTLLEKLHVELKPVVGISPSEDWQEASFAIFGLTRSQACDIATTFQQRGIFELSNEKVLVIETSSHEIKRHRQRITR